MGNLLIPGPSNPLLSPIQPPLQILSNCTKNSGTYTEVHQVTKKSTRTIFIPSSSLKYFLSSTPASGKENQLIPKFSQSQDSKLNIMELMSSLILYSSCSLSEKVHLSFEVFDFDKNEVITKDEMVILCLSFLKGAAIMTQTAFFSKKIMKKLADEAFILADSNPDGQITKNE
jgi:Ca2+-binding EF-hand superfamily protein